MAVPGYTAHYQTQGIKAAWVNVSQDAIINIGVGIQSSLEPNRITRDIPPDIRIIIPIVVVECARLRERLSLSYFSISDIEL
jgi:hypothetical protein